MKKYYQATLALTAALSLIALLFYRHEYNKLRFVLQVFNYFGGPIPKGDCNCTLPIVTWNNNDSEFTLPESSWQRLSENLHIYSAYNIDNGEIRAIGFGKDIDVVNYSCHIFFDDDIESIVATFSYEKISNDVTEFATNPQSKYHGYLLTCKFTKIYRQVIVGVQFINVAQAKFDDIPIIKVHTLNTNVNISDNVICVSPPTSRLMKHVDMISFLAFHHYIGWKNFVVYDSGISHVLSNSLKNMAKISDSWNFTYTTIPWNFPYAQIPHRTIHKIIETDCIHRTYNKAKTAVTLSWNEYINLRYHNTVEHVLSNINNDSGKMIDKFRLRTLVFCSNQVNDNTLFPKIPAMLRTTRRLKKVIDNEPHYIYKLANILSANVIEQNIGDLIFINRYQKCYTEDKREIIDNEMLKFVEYMPNTKIFRYYMTGKLFHH